MVDKGRISSQDWEQVFQDFRGTAEARNKWLSQHGHGGILEQALQAASRKDFPLKLQILAFVEENAALLVEESGLDLLLEALRSTLHVSTPSDGNASAALAMATSFKEQMMITVTSIMVNVEALSCSPRSLEILVEMLLNFINRPNHSAERHLRATACECLRELEKAYPCLLHSSSGHLLALCQSERTHAGQSYTLLLTTVLRNIAHCMQHLRLFYAGTYSILFTTLPLVPFTVPAFLSDGSVPSPSCSSSYRDFSEECIKEFRRVISFLLERPNLLTESALVVFISDLCHIATCLDLQASLLKLQFWNLLHVYSPISCHALLTIFTRFPEAFEGDELDIYKRLVLFTREYAQPLAVRLLALHWVMGLENLIVSRGREHVLPSVAKSLYPEVFDPLSLKAAKLECLARCAAILDRRGAIENEVHVIGEAEADMATKLLNDGLVCLSSYKWLPPHSTETRLLFHILHRFLVSGFPHPMKAAVDSQALADSILFSALQEKLVTMARNVRMLADRILSLLDRFLSCDAHRCLGECLLRTFSKDLIPSLPPNLHLPAYFPLMERIAESSKIPPGALITSLAAYLRHRVSKDSGKDAARLWLRGSEVLTICRTLLMHQQSSRIFHKLTALLAYLCLSFPDIEVRDNARFYLRMLISVPGNRLRDILMYGDERKEESRPQLLHVSSFLGSPSPRAYQAKKQSLHVSSFIHLTREKPLLVRSSWSLVLHDSFQPIVETFTEEQQAATQNDVTVTTDGVETDGVDFAARLSSEQEQVPRMMDAKTADALRVLRKHFSEVPESGVKIEVICRLKVKFLSISEAVTMQDPSELPAIYAAVLSFSTSGLYGPIPSVRVPYLPSEPIQRAKSTSPITSPSSRLQETTEEEVRRVKFLEGCDPNQQESDEANRFVALVKIELEPQQPVPTLVDCHIVFSNEEAETIQEQLESICVGIEDLFMKPPLPPDVSNQREYLLNLFNALWYGCSGPGKLGSEIFTLKGGRQGLGLQGSESVKLLEAQADRVVSAVENYLGGFVVSVSGDALGQMTRDSGKFEKALWIEEQGADGDGTQVERENKTLVEGEEQTLRLDLSPHEFASDSDLVGEEEKGGKLGCFLVLIFLPPRYHLLLRMEVSDWSTLIRIRTDYWPSLAHIDEFLESFTIQQTSSL